MKLLIKNGRVIDPATGFDEVCDVSVAAGRIVAIKNAVPDFSPNKVNRCKRLHRRAGV